VCSSDLEPISSRCLPHQFARFSETENVVRYYKKKYNNKNINIGTRLPTD
jgi:hypothetical protein